MYVYVCVYTHAQMQRQTGEEEEEEEKARRVRTYTQARIANARGKKEKEKIVELILRRRTPYKNSVLYVRYVLNEKKKRVLRKGGTKSGEMIFFKHEVYLYFR